MHLKLQIISFPSGEYLIALSGSFSPFPVSTQTISEPDLTTEEATRRGVVNMALIRSMAKAKYQETNIGHFGLASKCYTHFTSPIRRYP